MSFFISNTQSEADNNNNNFSGEDPEEQETSTVANVSSHVCLKSAHSAEPLDKDVVLRRIRQRKRVNKVRAAVQRFVGSPVSSKSDNEVCVRWVDDAFAAL